MQDSWLTYTEMVPQLLAHLNVSHVSVASHSGGDIYLMNLILTYPHLLHPEHPYVCFFAPWVHYSHSRMTNLLATELLPASMIGKFGAVGRFVNQNIIPLVGLSGGFVHGISDPLMHSNAAPAPIAPAGSGSDRSSNSFDMDSEDIRLDDPQVVDEVRTHIMKFLYAESVDGVSHDAQLFLKRSAAWNASGIDWNDFDDAVELLSRHIREDNGGNRVWTIDCFHAEEDQMVGEKGKKWFSSIWVPSTGYKYRGEDVKGTEHNFLMDPAFGASDVWLQRVSETWKAPEDESNS